ncbi:MAG: nuclear transport factor 2 family protein [Myxococcota bacterium]|nr:nuclear transport factor 2 family protein [Myxococcota bacterium]
MATTAELNRKLDEAIFSGKALEAFEEYYAETVVMQENTDPPWEGKDVNRKRELEFFATIEAWHGGKVLAAAADGDVSFSESEMDVTIKGAGRVQMSQVAVRRWQDGKIVHERFYHK